jgi:phenylacetate-CoA ligase
VDGRDEVILLVETTPAVDSDAWAALEHDLGADLAQAHEGLRFRVHRAATDELPRFELKAKRLTDLRPGHSPAPRPLAPAPVPVAPTGA